MDSMKMKPMKMNSINNEMLRRLSAADWFVNVGKKDTDQIRVLNSWAEANDTLVSTKWEDITLEAANRIGDKIIKISKEKYNLWNDYASFVKPRMLAIVEEKTRLIVRTQNLHPTFRRIVEWDMIHLGIENEYAELCGLGFFNLLAEWYLKGHFPCGWEGEFPNGKLIIY